MTNYYFLPGSHKFTTWLHLLTGSIQLWISVRKALNLWTETPQTMEAFCKELSPGQWQWYRAAVNTWRTVTWSCSSCIRMAFSHGSLTDPTMDFFFSCRHKWYRSINTACWLGWEDLSSVVFVRLWRQGVSLYSISVM